MHQDESITNVAKEESHTFVYGYKIELSVVNIITITIR